MPKKSLRRAIDAHCKGCCYDNACPGTWRAQVTLCPIIGCELYNVRPTTHMNPESVIEYYGATQTEIIHLGLKIGLKEGLSERTADIDSRDRSVA